jgi:hypothetical protein
MDICDGFTVLRLTQDECIKIILATRISNISDLQTLGDLLELKTTSINVYPWQLTWISCILGLSKPASDVLLS